jgi:SsrA-binding protein
MSDKKPDTAVATNRKAYHDYFIEETFEAGIVLQGTEVKSLRLGLANLTDSYAIVKKEEMFLLNANISPYPQGNIMNHEPLKIYFVRGKAKALIGLAKGKKAYDKRETIKEKESKREVERVVKERNR